MTDPSRPALDEPRDDETEILRWLRLTSPRRTVEPERTSRVRSAVHGAWREALQQRRRRRRRWWTAAAAVALISTLGAWTWNRRGPVTPPAQLPAGVIVAIAGSGPAIETASGSRPLQVGDMVPAGAGLHARAPLSMSWLEPRVQLRLDQDARIRFDGPRAVFVERGRVYFDTGSTRAGAIEVRTPYGLVQDIGTRFEIRVSGELRVRIREGSVKLTRGGEAREAGAGAELTATSSAIVERTFDVADTDWSWITRAGPRFVLEGQTLRSFLDWVSLEAGRTIRFADERIGREKRDTVLHGTIDGLSPTESLDVVLPACGLTYRVERDVLTIMAPSEKSGERR